MMMSISRFFSGNRTFVGIGVFIIVITNFVALAGVAYNRAGQPDAVVELSERELDIPYRYGFYKENTGMQLRIQCRVEETEYFGYYYSGCSGTPGWLDYTKLLELGFNLEPWSEKVERRWGYRSELPHEVYVVLEFDGDAYSRAVAGVEKELKEKQSQLATAPDNKKYQTEAEQAQKRLDAETQDNSRLFIIDAGRDKAALRTAYPDIERYVLMRALVRAVPRNSDKSTEWHGTITRLLVDSINVPLEYRHVFENRNSSQSATNEPKLQYVAQIAFGKRSEPWIIGARKP